MTLARLFIPSCIFPLKECSVFGGSTRFAAKPVSCSIKVNPAKTCAACCPAAPAASVFLLAPPYDTTTTHTLILKLRSILIKRFVNLERAQISAL